MSPNSDEMAELCEGIAEVLEKRGHATYTMEDSYGAVCLLGAGRVAQIGDCMLTESYITHDSRAADTKTTEALGFSNPTAVAQHNDGYTQRVVKSIPRELVFTNDSAVIIQDTVYDTYVEEVRYPPLDKQKAIDFAMERAKYWRNK